MATNFHWIDAAIIVAYLLTLTAVGVYFSWRQTNLDDFFLARRGMAGNFPPNSTTLTPTKANRRTSRTRTPNWGSNSPQKRRRSTPKRARARRR